MPAISTSIICKSIVVENLLSVASDGGEDAMESDWWMFLLGVIKMPGN